ncbi:MAG TPA: ElyC/SanA/YdcF family protein [Opitutales bacterium]|nr:ElyC/SanA/YdcF family protein [Opitutales bacterium]
MSLQRAERPRSWKRRLWRAGLLLLAVALLGLLAIVMLNWWVIQAANGKIYTRLDHLAPRPVALVLGAGPGSFYFEDRLDAAAQLYQAGKVSHLLVSGEGDAQDPYGSETALMYQGLVRRGVPKSAITRDDAGFRTLDSMARARRVFGLNSVIIVSQPFHLPRSIYLAQNFGLDAVGYAATDPGGDFYHTTFREWFARVKAVLDIQFLRTPPRLLGPPQPLMLDAPTPARP